MVAIPVILRFLPLTSSYVMSPVTLRSPMTVASPPTVKLPLTVDAPETTASLALKTPTVATPRILRLVSTVISSFMNKLLPTYKSQPVVVIPPEDAVVVTPAISKPVCTLPPTYTSLMKVEIPATVSAEPT